MLNHHRGLWGYSGPAADGAPLTIQSSGLGGPSASAVVAELVGLGARRLIRVGTCSGLGDTRLGTVVIAREAIAADGASRALGAGARAADLSTAAVLVAAAGGGATAASVLGVTRAGDAVADEAGLESLEARLGEIALAALPAAAT